MASAIPLALTFGAQAISAGVGAGAVASALITGGAALIGAFIIRDSVSVANTPDADSIKINSRSTQRVIPLVYGTRKVGGNDVFVEMTGKGGRDLWIIHCLGEGTMDGLVLGAGGLPEIYIDGEPMYSSNRESAADTSPFEKLVQWWFHSGNPDDPPPSSPGGSGGNSSFNSELNSAFPGFDDTMKHTAYIVFKIDFDSKVFSRIPTREVIVNGIKVLDFRTGEIIHSSNPALILYDFFTNNRYGLGIDKAIIDADSSGKSSWGITANYCDSFPWTLNAVFGSHVKASDIIDTILSHFRGYLSWHGGMVRLGFHDVSPVVASITDAHIVSDDDFVPHLMVKQPSGISTPSGIVVQYVNKEMNWSSDEIPVGKVAGNIRRISYPGYTDKDMALTMGYYSLERMSLNRMFTVLCRGDLMNVESGDRVSLEASEISLKKTKMVVVETETVFPDKISISMVYDSDYLYDRKLDEIDTVLYKTKLANPDVPPGPVLNASVTEESYVNEDVWRSDLNVYFEPPPDVYYRETDISYKIDTGAWEQSFRVTEPFKLNNVTRGVTYFIMFKTVNLRGIVQELGVDDVVILEIKVGIRDDELIIPCVNDLFATVNVTSVGLFAEPIETIDAENIKDYEFRYGPVDSSWGEGLFLASVPKPSLSYSGIKPGTYKMFINTLGINEEYCKHPKETVVYIEEPPPFHKEIARIPIDYTAGTHEGTVAESKTLLRLSHDDGKMTGMFSTNILSLNDYIMEPYKIANDRWYLAYVDFNYTIRYGGHTWKDIWPPPSTWSQGCWEGRKSWKVISGQGTKAPKLNIRMRYGDTFITEHSTINRMELMSGVFRGLVAKLEYRLEDTSLSSYLIVQESSLVICERQKSGTESEHEDKTYKDTLFRTSWEWDGDDTDRIYNKLQPISVYDFRDPPVYPKEYFKKKAVFLGDAEWVRDSAPNPYNRTYWYYNRYYTYNPIEPDLDRPDITFPKNYCVYLRRKQLGESAALKTAKVHVSASITFFGVKDTDDSIFIELGLGRGTSGFSWNENLGSEPVSFTVTFNATATILSASDPSDRFIYIKTIKNNTHNPLYIYGGVLEVGIAEYLD